MLEDIHREVKQPSHRSHPEDITPEHASAVSPDTYNNAYQFPFHIDSDTMAAPRLTRVAASALRAASPWSAERPHILFGRGNPPPPSHCGLGTGERAPSPKAPGGADRPSPAPAPLQASHTMVISAPSTTSTGSVRVVSEGDNSPELKHCPPCSPASTSLRVRPSERPNQSRCSVAQSGSSVLATLVRCVLLGLVVTCPLATANRLALYPLLGLLHPCPMVTVNRFALRNGYGTVEARYHLTVYDCSDPTEVQEYSSISASQCSVRATPVQKDRPTKFQLLQKERKRYITAYSCFLSRMNIRYNCGAYGDPELDPIHWSFAVPKRVTVEQCMTWLRTRSYRPTAYSTMMHGKDFHQAILVDEPNYITYMVYGRTYTKAPSLQTDQVLETAC